jgi:hypothetical protein
MSVPELEVAVRGVGEALPIARSRLHGETWVPGPPPAVVTVEGHPLEWEGSTRRFRLGDEPPLRIVVGGDGATLGLVAHHAAFDGLGLVAVARALIDDVVPKPALSPPPGPAGRSSALPRLLLPADRVAASPRKPNQETFAALPIAINGRSVTARLAAACAIAAKEHNTRLGARFRRIGISVGVGRPELGAGNVASYRRVDVRGPEAARAAVEIALAKVIEPPEQARRTWWLPLLEPIAGRFSDSVLVSNIGRQELSGAAALHFFPVSRGRSAVAFGAAGLHGGASSLSIRARDLDIDDARAMLDAAIAHFEATRGDLER